MGNKHICLPFASEGQYREYVDDPAQYRQYLNEMLSQHPELFPQDMDQGFTFHDAYVSGKQDLIVRRIKLELFLNKIERSSKVQHRCQRHHPQNQLCDCGRHAPKCYSVSCRQWHAQ
jgi:hypothetical protein